MQAFHTMCRQDNSRTVSFPSFSAKKDHTTILERPTGGEFRPCPKYQLSKTNGAARLFRFQIKESLSFILFFEDTFPDHNVCFEWSLGV